MISPETVLALAIQNTQVMDELGEALRSDLVLANPFLRRIAEFADEFLLQRRKLPASGDWELWLDTLPQGMIRDGTRETLGRLMVTDVSQYDGEFFASTVLPSLQKAATLVARARLNELNDLDPSLLINLADSVQKLQQSNVMGLARLSDIDVWSKPVREDEYIGTGFPTLNHYIGGWGKELWIAFADSGVGKSIMLQNFASNAAVRGRNVLHVTLELGLRAQIHRYYRQIVEMPRADFVTQPDLVRSRLTHWFKFAKGQVLLLELPPFSMDADQLKRTIDRLIRILKIDIHVVVVDYLDLMAPTKRSSKGGAYEDLGRMTHELRSVTSTFDSTVLTASQSVRRPAKAGRLTMQDMGDSYNKVRGADGLISLVQTPEEEEMFQGRLGLLKVRDSGGRGQEIGLYINRELSVIQELAHPNTMQLMQRLGHLPSQLQQRAQASAAPVGGSVRGGP